MDDYARDHRRVCWSSVRQAVYVADGTYVLIFSLSKDVRGVAMLHLAETLSLDIEIKTIAEDSRGFLLVLSRWGTLLWVNPRVQPSGVLAEVYGCRELRVDATGDLALICADKGLQLWRIEPAIGEYGDTLKLISGSPHAHSLHDDEESLRRVSCDLSAGGSLAITGGSDGAVRVWHVDRTFGKFTLCTENVLAHDGRPVSSTIFGKSDGTSRIFAFTICSVDRAVEFSLRVWHIEILTGTMALVAEPEFARYELDGMMPSGNFLLAWQGGGEGGTARLIENDTARGVRVVAEAVDNVPCSRLLSDGVTTECYMGVNSSGTLVLSILTPGGLPGAVKLWRVEELSAGERLDSGPCHKLSLVQRTAGVTRDVTSMRASANGRCIVTGEASGMLRAWECSPDGSLTHAGDAHRHEFSEDRDYGIKIYAAAADASGAKIASVDASGILQVSRRDPDETATEYMGLLWRKKAASADLHAVAINDAGDAVLTGDRSGYLRGWVFCEYRSEFSLVVERRSAHYHKWIGKIDLQGKLALTTDTDGRWLRLWHVDLRQNLESNRLVLASQIFEGCGGGSRQTRGPALSFDSGGAYFLTGGYQDGVLRLWQIDLSGGALEYPVEYSASQWQHEPWKVNDKGEYVETVGESGIPDRVVVPEPTTGSMELIAKVAPVRAWGVHVTGVCLDVVKSLAISLTHESGSEPFVNVWRIHSDPKQFQLLWRPWLSDERIGHVVIAGDMCVCSTPRGLIGFSLGYTQTQSRVALRSQSGDNFFEHKMRRHGPLISYIGTTMSGLINAGQLLRFAFSVPTPPAVKVSATLKFCQYFGLDDIPWEFGFWGAVGLVTFFVVSMMLLETIAEKKFLWKNLGGRSAMWQYLFLVVETYCKVVSDVGLIATLNLLLKPFLIEANNAPRRDDAIWTFMGHERLFKALGVICSLIFLFLGLRLMRAGQDMSRVSLRWNPFNWRYDLRPANDSFWKVYTHPLATRPVIYNKVLLANKVLLSFCVRFSVWEQEKALRSVIAAATAVLTGTSLVVAGRVFPLFSDPDDVFPAAPQLPFSLNANSLRAAVDVGLTWQYMVQLAAALYVLQFGKQVLQNPAFTVLPASMPLLMLAGYWERKYKIARDRAARDRSSEGASTPLLAG